MSASPSPANGSAGCSRRHNSQPPCVPARSCSRKPACSTASRRPRIATPMMHSKRAFPKVKLVRGVRFVDNGTTATATGLTAGLDLALHITNRFYGPKVTQLIADYEEWPTQEWQHLASSTD